VWEGDCMLLRVAGCLLPIANDDLERHCATHGRRSRRPFAEALLWSSLWSPLSLDCGRAKTGFRLMLATEGIGTQSGAFG